MKVNVEKIIELYDRGYGVAQISKIINRHPSTVHKHLLKYKDYKKSARNLPIKERLLFHSYPEPMSGCWLWGGNICPNGYGLVKHDKKQRLAHRVSYIVFKGEIPHGMCACHHCDVPSCINPDHLFIGTLADNVADKTKKNRCGNYGTLNPASRYTESQIYEVISLRKSGWFYKDIAKKFKTSKESVRRICIGETWGTVTKLTYENKPKI